jgi:putative ABC transport system permease protein
VTTVFSFSPSSLAAPLCFATLAVIALLAWRALRVPHLVRIGVRNVPRRRLRTVLIVFGLMLSTTFVAAAIAVDDTIVLAVKTVAVYNLGRIDETVVPRGGTSGPFAQRFGTRVSGLLANDPNVAGVAPALETSNILVADETARQVRGGVLGVGIDATTGGTLTELSTVETQTAAPVESLGTNEIYLNRTLGKLLNAHAGDAIYLYSTDWPGKRFLVHVSGIVQGGFLGESPTFVANLPTMQKITEAGAGINAIYIANTGNGLSGVNASDEVVSRLAYRLPGFLHVREVKQDGINFSLQAQDIFGRILTLFTLFVFAIGLLLIFLIFSLLAAERRPELGMARAMGMRRWQIVQMLLFEGLVYDGAAALLGMLSGLALGVLVVKLVSPVLAQVGFPLQLDINPSGMLVSFCLGALFTLATIALAAWNVSRMTIAAALRDMPEPPAPQPSLVALARSALRSSSRFFVAPGQVLAAYAALVFGVISRGIVPLAIGLWLMSWATEQLDALTFSLGLSIALAGAVLVARWLVLASVAAIARRITPEQALWQVARAQLLADRLTALAIGGGLALYWSLPFDALQGLGLPRFSGGILIFFVAGVMMVFGMVIALAPNLDLLLAPVRWILIRLGRLRHVSAVALLYPAYHRFRTGIGLALFSLVCFTMVVMACIAASTTHSYDNLPAQAAGYDIAGQPLFSPVGGVSKLENDLRSRSPSASGNLAAVASATPVPLGVIQPGSPDAAWRIYPGSQVQGSFLDGVGLPLIARASGYASDDDVWQAVRAHPGYVVIDAGALSEQDANQLNVTLPPAMNPAQFVGPPIASGLPGLNNLEALQGNPNTTTTLQPGNFNALALLAADPQIAREYTLRLRGIVNGPGQITPATLWISDARGSTAVKVTVIGIVQNAHGERFGLFGSPATFAGTEKGLAPFGNEYYYFKVRPGVDVQSQALALGSALLNNGFETTVLQDLLLDVNGPRVFISRVLVGLVGLTLLVGAAALAVTGSRAVVERRQQIGMLRALGFRRAHVQLLFLIEALLIGIVGTALGVALGLLLCRNIFAVDFFAQYQSGLDLVVPWNQLILLCIAAVSATLLAAVIPVWQAGRIAPADALRYE